MVCVTLLRVRGGAEFVPTDGQFFPGPRPDGDIMPPVTPPPFLDYINYRINELARFKGDEKGNPLTILASTVAAVVKRSLRKIDDRFIFA